MRTKVVAHALVSWMMSDDDLKDLKPRVLTSIHAGNEAGGQSLQQQQQTIDLFTKGDCKLMVSTSVGEEGLNIPACNMVVKYDQVSTVVSMIQSDGRARQENAAQFVIGDDSMEQRYDINLLMETILENGIKTTQQLDEEEFMDIVHKKQEQQLMLYKYESEQSKQRSTENDAKDISLICNGCEEFVCSLDQVRKTQNAYIVPDENFKTKIKLTPHPKKREQAQGIQKMRCAKCESDWGRAAEGFQCLGMSRGSFKVKVNGQVRPGIKKWSDIPCTIQPFAGIRAPKLFG